MDKNTSKLIRGTIILLGAFGAAAGLCLASNDGIGTMVFTFSFLTLAMFVAMLAVMVITLEE